MRFGIRADASVEIGTGHVSRCLALAEKLISDNHEVILYTSEHKISWLNKRIEKLGILVEYVELDSLSNEYFKNYDPNFVILDSYNFQPSDTKKIFTDYPTLSLADDIRSDYFAHIYLNQNLGAEKSRFNSPVKARHLLGPSFALIRQNLQSAREYFQFNGDHGFVKVICLTGGSTSSSATINVAKMLARHEGISEVLFIGANILMPQIKSMLPNLDLQFVEFTPNLHEYILASDVAVSAAGSTVLELSAIGIPTAYLPIASNQLPYLREISNSECGLVLTQSLESEIESKIDKDFENLLFDEKIRKKYSSNARNLVDGMGSNRVAATMIEFLENQR